MTYSTQDEAQRAGEAVLARLHGTGWTLDVFENLGWYYTCHLKQLSLHHNRDGYSTLLDNNPKADGSSDGSRVWINEPSYHDPNMAVKHQLAVARKVVDSLNGIVTALEKVIRKT